MLFDVGDVNEDGLNEIVASAGKDLVILDSEGNLLFKRSHTHVIYYIRLMDLDNDTVPEITYALKDGKYRIFVLNVGKGEHEEPEVFDFTDSLNAHYRGAEDVSIEPVVAYDIDDDGKTEILAVIATGYSWTPRGILALEYPSGDREWFYKSAPNVAIDAFADIDKDGKPEIILSSHSSCNGNEEGQRDDYHVYLTVLNLNSEEVWSQEIASGFKELEQE